MLYLCIKDEYLFKFRLHICIFIQRHDGNQRPKPAQIVHLAKNVSLKHNYSFFCLHFYARLL